VGVGGFVTIIALMLVIFAYYKLAHILHGKKKPKNSVELIERGHYF